MGSGKSTVGRALARRVGRPHVDTDDMVVETTGRSIPEIFDAEGEARFRQYEAEALDRALDAGAVVSTGGGIVTDDRNRARLRDGDVFVVWLDGSIDALVGRVGTGRGRPLLEGTDIRATLREKLTERGPGYLDVADVRIDTSRMRRKDCVDAIVAAMEGARA